MPDTQTDLDALQAAYKTAVDAWRTAIREEEALVAATHNVAEIDLWESAHFREDDSRRAVKAAKQAYEDALRRAHFHF